MPSKAADLPTTYAGRELQKEQRCEPVLADRAEKLLYVLWVPHGAPGAGALRWPHVRRGTVSLVLPSDGIGHRSMDHGVNVPNGLRGQSRIHPCRKYAALVSPNSRASGVNRCAAGVSDFARRRRLPVDRMATPVAVHFVVSVLLDPAFGQQLRVKPQQLSWRLMSRRPDERERSSALVRCWLNLAAEAMGRTAVAWWGLEPHRHAYGR